jgi:hypothetical protein
VTPAGAVVVTRRSGASPSRPWTARDEDEPPALSAAAMGLSLFTLLIFSCTLAVSFFLLGRSDGAAGPGGIASPIRSAQQTSTQPLARTGSRQQAPSVRLAQGKEETQASPSDPQRRDEPRSLASLRGAVRTLEAAAEPAAPHQQRPQPQPTPRAPPIIMKSASPLRSPPPSPLPTAPAPLARKSASSSPSSSPSPPTEAARTLIQLGAFSSQARAEQAWQQATRRHPEIAGMSKRIVPFASGMRLRVAARSHTQAAKLCSALAETGQACFVVP